ncbi:Lsr2 family protein [Pseudonocardia sp. ICBG1142]|uniref:histone-like nucleoid-structuring protein Lsr2 n=1 Tax=Pseudonocardia sp. ICBG1142 TaxID=2846760 RepID=UPI0027DEAE79|nr:Lsr2 family protein [Pseudonocardia sp. ICBG1142]
MAQIKTIRLVDDLTGQPADETLEFGVDGKRYEIELSADNAPRLRNVLAEYVAAARRKSVAARPPQWCRAACGRRPRAQPNNMINKLVRTPQWARARGMKVSDRGRIPAGPGRLPRTQRRVS